MSVDFISEARDNFRDPIKNLEMTNEHAIINYLQNENQKLIKKKVQKNLDDLDKMVNFTTEYREQTKK